VSWAPASSLCTPTAPQGQHRVNLVGQGKQPLRRRQQSLQLAGSLCLWHSVSSTEWLTLFSRLTEWWCLFSLAAKC
jgi:hypothetical protein